jgi:hypothetical protein
VLPATEAEAQQLNLADRLRLQDGSLPHAWLGAAMNFSSMNSMYGNAVSRITAQREG